MWLPAIRLPGAAMRRRGGANSTEAPGSCRTLAGICPKRPVAADAHHRAAVDWTRPTGGFHYLTVYATTRSGIQLAPCDYCFTVN